MAHITANQEIVKVKLYTPPLDYPLNDKVRVNMSAPVLHYFQTVYSMNTAHRVSSLFHPDKYDYILAN